MKKVHFNRWLLAVLFITSTDILALPILDQVSVGGGSLRNNIYDNRNISQTFTVGVTGILDSIDVELRYDDLLPTDILSAEIYTTSTKGLPDLQSGILASTSFTPTLLATGDLNDGWDFFNLDFSISNLLLNQADQYALVLSSNATFNTSAVWRATRDGDNYIGGSAYTGITKNNVTKWPTKNYDHHFKTYVNPISVPEPATLYLFLFALFALSIRRPFKYKL